MTSLPPPHPQYVEGTICYWFASGSGDLIKGRRKGFYLPSLTPFSFWWIQTICIVILKGWRYMCEEICRQTWSCLYLLNIDFKWLLQVKKLSAPCSAQLVGRVKMRPLKSRATFPQEAYMASLTPDLEPTWLFDGRNKMSTEYHVFLHTKT